MKNKHLLSILFVLFSSIFALSAHADDELKGKTLTVFIDPFSAPSAFFTDQIREPVGMDVDVIYELKKRLGFELTDNRILPLPLGDAIDSIKSGKADWWRFIYYWSS